MIPCIIYGLVLTILLIKEPISIWNYELISCPTKMSHEKQWFRNCALVNVLSLRWMYCILDCLSVVTHCVDSTWLYYKQSATKRFMLIRKIFSYIVCLPLVLVYIVFARLVIQMWVLPIILAIVVLIFLVRRWHQSLKEWIYLRLSNWTLQRFTYFVTCYSPWRTFNLFTQPEILN